MNKSLTFKEIKELDTITIKGAAANLSFPGKDYRMKPVFKTGVIKFNLYGERDNHTYYTVVDSEKNTIELYVYYKDFYHFTRVFRVDLTLGSPNFTNIDDERIQNEKEHFLNLIFNLMAYLSYTIENKDVRVQAHKENRLEANSDGKKGYSKKNYSVLDKEKVIYTINTSNSISKRSYNRHTESWGVVGHPRHYKSGKVVWIKPCTKGTGKKIAKEYLIG